MIEINEVLNKSGKIKCFVCNREIEVIGNLFAEGNQYLLYINISPEDFSLFRDATILRFYGQIAGRDFTIPNGYVKKTECRSHCWSMTIIPEQIVLGICTQEELKVDKITAQTTSLNPMFVSAPAEMAVPSLDNSALINLVPVQPLCAEDEEMKIYCTRTVGFSESVSGIEIPFVVLLECDIKHSVSLETALARIASARNLFTFFGDRYIPLENIEISIGTSKKMCNERKYTVVLNYSENIDTTNRPFFIGSDLLTDDFQSIWTNWAKLYKESKNIAALFYEIICERSRGIITAGGANNGIGYFVGNENDSRAEKSISVVRNGASVCKAFYHKYSALYGNDCRRMKLKCSDSEFVNLFITQTIGMQNKSFSYSRKLGTERLLNLKIMLPVTDAGKPDYGYMEQYAKNMMLKKYRQYIAFLDSKEKQPQMVR